MRNHDEKIGDMTRSAFPSTARKRARYERTRIHRRERSVARNALRDLRSLEDAWDSEDDTRYEDRSRISHMVEARREYDKLAPMLRWAERWVRRSRVSTTSTASPVHLALPRGTISGNSQQRPAWD